MSKIKPSVPSCGNCNHWVRLTQPNDPWGTCVFPLPLLPMSVRPDKRDMRQDYGVGCPCYEPTQRGQR